MKLLNSEKLYCDLKKPTTRNRYFYYFTVIVFMFVIIFIMNIQYMYQFNYKAMVPRQLVDTQNTTNVLRQLTNTLTSVNEEIKYILLWTNNKFSPFIYFGKGRSIFITRKCKWTNCFVTSDRNYLGYYTEFEVIAFNGPQLSSIYNIHDIPSRRSSHQKYVFANIEAAANYPVATKVWNAFFNWTWTYKLDSDSYWGYFAIRNSTKYVIGPKVNMHWINLIDMDPIDEELKQTLKTKNKAAAWFSSNCYTLSLREEYVNKIRAELKKYHLQVDTYGSCGTFKCPKEKMDSVCLKIVEKHYYFFFAFENAFSQDYVTEKVVYALNHNTVPVVFGGANYSRFMPHGSYLNAVELGPEGLAKKMYEIIQNPVKYYDFFRWKKYYSFHFLNESPETDEYCQICALLNNETLIKTKTVYENFDSWWTANMTS